ncbi:MAG TPA: lysogenization regulator HflD [Methylothermaceae bacterium]|nr:lysogenization regulator HflD [Methylothermaceae bacterium]
MLKSTRNQVIALAGLAQAVHLVQQIAQRGQADADTMAASIGSTLKIDSESVEDVYGGLEGIRAGLLKLQQQLGGRGQIDPEHARYSAQLVMLQGRLAENAEAKKQVRAGVEQAAGCARKNSLLDETVLEILAETYHRNISPLGPKIIITGERVHLSNPGNANKIRALLLAGVRSAVLWRQCGGAKWKFLFNRRRLQHEVQSLLAELNAD